MKECTVRYDYASGDGRWSHPHIIPGVFISAEQQYRGIMRKGKKKEGKEMRDRGDTNGEGQNDPGGQEGGQKLDQNNSPHYENDVAHDFKHRDKNGEQEETRKMKREGEEEAETSTQSTSTHPAGPAPPDQSPSQTQTQSAAIMSDTNTTLPKRIWQIIFTDGPNDSVYAHLYTAQVPEYLIKSFKNPARRHVFNDKEEGEQKEVQFEFPIWHTRIPYRPYNTFRERLHHGVSL
ncbi:hypothetical protein F5Y08DRAFT_350933 [Xylaria arbuscula]|nr:hypothetical protein F5Y08DRAFT_350933 [Xylaria arbuscula]